MLSSRLLVPSSCCILCSNWEGFLSPSSSAVRSCWSLFCSDDDVRRISSALRVSYRSCLGGEMSRSRTSWANSGCRDDTTWENLEDCARMFLVSNCASTWANHRWGSCGQKGGSLSVTVIADNDWTSFFSATGCST